MDNKDLFLKSVEDCANLKYDLKNSEYQKLNSIKKVFKGFFDKDPKEFMLYVDSHIYNGGFPLQESPSKIAKISHDLAKLLMYYKFTGKSKELEKHLETYNIKLDLSDVSVNSYVLENIDYTLDKKRKKLIDKNWSVLSDQIFETDSNKLLEFLLKVAIDSKKKVIQVNEKINTIESVKIETECEISKPNFIKAVNLKYKKLIGKDITSEVDNLDNSMDSLKDILNII